MTKEEEEKIHKIVENMSDEEIEDRIRQDEQEKAIENLTDLLKQRNEKKVKITTYDLFENIETVLSILKEKDKQIELMARAMDKIQDPQVCKYCDNKINLNHGYCVDAGKCKDGIKQYFEQKAIKMS